MKASTIQMLSNAGLAGASLLIPNLARDEFGSSTVEIGTIVAGYNAAVFISCYMFGRASDVYGRRTILIVGLLLSTIACVLHLFADSTFALAIIRVIVGICAGVFPSALIAYVYESSKKIGKFTSWGSFGFGAGTFIAGFIGIYYQIFLFSAALLAASFALSLFLPFGKETLHKVAFFPRALIKRNFPVYSSIMLRHIGANMIWVTYPIFLADLGADPLFIGGIYAVNAFGQFFFMQLLDRFSSSSLVAFGFIFSAVTFPTYTFAIIYWQIVPAQIILAAAWSCLYVGSMKYVMERNDEKGTAVGILQSVLSVSAILGALLGGAVSFAFGYHGAMYVATGLAVAGLILFAMSDTWMRTRIRKGFNHSNS
ncbi:MAG: MFS transporter [Methanomassiliicoccales archaeon]|nr:MFS transporter [Methanomassiliicoccales archaeon]